MGYTSLVEIHHDLESGSITLPEIVRSYLDRISESKHLNAFIEVYESEALHSASLIQQKIENKTAGKLAGMVVGLKDNICFKGHSVTAGSRILQGFTSLFSSTVVEKLLNEDAIIIGRLNCDEFAMGSSNEKSFYGPVLNPIDNKCVPGGSSGGSAAAVAAGLCLVALGSDTGGSIRQPASYTGTVGLKPTYGRVSRHGLIAYASSFDQIGPIANSIEDVAVVLEVISGPDNYDSTTLPSPFIREKHVSKDKLKIAVLKDCMEKEGLNIEVKIRFLELIKQLENEGHQINWVDFPFVDQMVPTYYVITTAEASSNLARFDGIHFGYRSSEAKGIENTYKQSRTEGFGQEVKRRIMLGTFVLSSGYYEAYFSKAQKVRQVIQQKTEEILNQADVILIPTTADSAFEFGKKSEDPIAMYLEDIFTVQANLTGHPAISIPLGTKSNSRPFGLQIIGQFAGEGELIEVAKRLESLISGF